MGLDIWPILLLFALIYSWLLFNAAAWLIGRCKRFSVRSLLLVMTVVALVLGCAPKAVLYFPQLASLFVLTVIAMIVMAAIIRDFASK